MDLLDRKPELWSDTRKSLTRGEIVLFWGLGGVLFLLVAAVLAIFA